MMMTKDMKKKESDMFGLSAIHFQRALNCQPDFAFVDAERYSINCHNVFPVCLAQIFNDHYILNNHPSMNS